MPGDVDDVVRAAHDPQIAVFILETSIGGLVVTGVSGEIRVDVGRVVVPERWQTTRRQRRADDDVADMIDTHFHAFIVEYPPVVTRHRLATGAWLDRQQLQTGAVRAD